MSLMITVNTRAKEGAARGPEVRKNEIFKYKAEGGSCGPDKYVRY